MFRRYGDHRQIHVARDVEDRWVSTDCSHHLSLRIDRIDGPSEAILQYVVEELGPYGTPLAGSPDDGHASRTKERLDGCRLGHLFTLLRLLRRRRCRLDRKRDVESPILELVLDWESALS